MGTAKISDSLSGHPTDDPGWRAARAVVDDLAAGREVAAMARDAAQGEMLARVRSDTVGPDSLARDGLVTLFGRAATPADRATLTGEIIVSGPRARDVLGAISARHEPLLRDFLSTEEIVVLPDLVGMTVEQQLARLAEWLQRDAEQAGKAPPEPRRGEWRDIWRRALLPRRPEDQLLEDDGEPPAAPPPPPPPEDVIADVTLPEELRAEAALALGSAAVPLLRTAAKNPAEREFVVSTLVRLGRLPEARQTVREAAVRMGFDGESRAVSDAVRGALGDAVPRPEQGREGGWLRRALADCSAPNILAAAAGRERMVIPLLLSRKAELRTQRSASALVE